MAKTWVSFEVVKEAVSMSMLVDHYQINWLRKSKDQLRGRCPIHDGEGDRAFHISLSKDAFNCFSCGAKGNVLDFVAAMEKCSVRDAALKIAEWFLVDQGSTSESKPKAAAARGVRKRKAQEQEQEPAAINPPLGFQLRVDPEHGYAGERGLSKETVESFGCGLCLSKGTFAGRYVVPLHDGEGTLIGYAGRSTGTQDPKYLFPSAEKGFRKSHLLFNLHRVLTQRSEDPWVVVVEGFFDTMKVYQAGYPCVGVLGSSLSDEQAKLLRTYFQRVVVMFDGDEAGRAGESEAVSRIAPGVFVTSIRLADGKQPDLLSSKELQKFIEARIPTRR